MRFHGRYTAEQTRNAALVTVDYRPSLHTTLQLGVGALLGGRLDFSGQRYQFHAGPEIALSVSEQIVKAKRGIPFVLVTATLAASTSTTSEVLPAAAGTTRYTATDLRGGLVVGEPIVDSLAIFAVGRAFGGPVYWRYLGQSVVGTDTHHYQVGAGFSGAVLRTIDLYAEGVFAGERAISIGAGLSFLGGAREADLLLLPLVEETPQPGAGERRAARS